MKKNKAEKLPHSSAVKAASVTAGVAAGTAAVTGAKMAHDMMNDYGEEVIPVIDTEELDSIAEVANVENQNPVLETLVDVEEVEEAAPEATHSAPAHHAPSHHAAPAPAHTAPEVAEVADVHEEAPVFETPIAAGEELAEVITDEAEVISNPLDGELEVNVIGYDTVTMNDGSRSDFAFFENNGRQGVIVDSDQDGRADYMMLDTNGNGNIEDNEVYDIHSENLEMAQFADDPADIALDDAPMDLDVPEDQYYSLDDASSDYINDADVSGFMEA